MAEHTIGWIGTGRMGYALASRLRGFGHDITVYNRTRAKAEPLTGLGCGIVDRPVELSDRDVVFVMVSTSADLEEVLTGANGLLTDPDRAPRIIIDSSTVSAEASARMREAAAARGASLIAAPVSGNAKVIEAGKLTVAASGPRGAYGEVEYILEHMGRAVTYVGDGDVARLVKIAHNVFLGVVTQSMSEIVALVERGGVSRADFLAFLNESVMGSVFTRYKSPALVNLDFTPTFTNILMRKDMQLGLTAGKELGVPMPIAAATDMTVAQAIGAGHIADDFASVFLEQTRRSGYTPESENVVFDDGLAPQVVVA
ncbi:NAD(P)-dependent oxidoreductase [Microbacterium sp. ASV49]|uniref:NAD(P)-dependent oxidoreductase n=1 Tax=Microbacterium candidum TaxID=3041922 RepID=A0ABT7MWF2_9MICO|nr:NAD(P)-dependent oxidoreductase [Microbacterium sp. ASV49]MDL9978777.1 NAD(P)-dependent oxidoreductase [Microbacterium sp. ASV49]